MTQEEIIEMARKAGGIDLTNTRANVTIWIGTGTSDFLDAFAKLIAEKAIKEALAHPEQEPVAFASHGVVNWIADKQFQHEANLYIAPQRTWVGLTDEDDIDWDGTGNLKQLVEAVEAKLRSKNNG